MSDLDPFKCPECGEEDNIWSDYVDEEHNGTEYRENHFSGCERCGAEWTYSVVYKLTRVEFDALISEPTNANFARSHLEVG